VILTIRHCTYILSYVVIQWEGAAFALRVQGGLRPFPGSRVRSHSRMRGSEPCPRHVVIGHAPRSRACQRMWDPNRPIAQERGYRRAQPSRGVRTSRRLPPRPVMRTHRGRQEQRQDRHGQGAWHTRMTGPYATGGLPQTRRVGAGGLMKLGGTVGKVSSPPPRAGPARSCFGVAASRAIVGGRQKQKGLCGRHVGRLDKLESSRGVSSQHMASVRRQLK
jgi:hypothetical protein